MEKLKKGDLVKYSSPNRDEDPNQIFIIVEVFYDVENPRAKIEAINTGLLYNPSYTTPVKELSKIN